LGIGDSNTASQFGPEGQTRHVQSVGMVSREIAGETLAVPVRKGIGDLDSVYTFNELGARLWLMLEQGRTTEELADWVRANYDVSAERAFADVARFVAELREERLVRTA
jgi:coenzyme PQQ synthesis protein D (PqqD)